MKFVVTRECRNLGLRAGSIVLRNVKVADSPAALRAAIAVEVQAIRAKYSDQAAIRVIPEVVHFQEILRKVGVNPRKEQPSVERLLGYALKRGDLPAINSLVDAYNLVSVRSLCSLGAHDLDLITLPLELRLLTGSESFTPLGKRVPVPVTAGEYGYVDAQNRLLCRLDLLQAEFSKVTPNTKNALLIIEGTAGHVPDTVNQAFSDACSLISRHCGGTAEVVAKPEITDQY